MSGPIILIAAWLVTPTLEMQRLGIDDVEFIERFQTMDTCLTLRDRFRNSPDLYNTSLVFKCVDLRTD